MKKLKIIVTYLNGLSKIHPVLSGHCFRITLDKKDKLLVGTQMRAFVLMSLHEKYLF